MIEREKIEQAIAAQEGLRPLLGDAVVDASIAALRQSLQQSPPPAEAEQRKQVTVLFGDVSGFTAMSETLDAEEVRDIMNALWRRIDAAILAHGGHIDKHIGDAVMAIFGVPAASEDDPERAIHTALAMQKEVREFAAKTKHTLQMRIGVNTGPVLLGSVGSNSEFTAMGDAVNLASRLEHAAPVGGVMISHDTLRHVQGIFEVETLEPIAVKGKKEPVQVYVVKKAKPRAFTATPRGAGIETPMIGREAEIKILQDALRQAIEDRESQMVTVVGEAGLGKSRLLLEFDRWVELLPDRLWYFKGRASAHTLNSPYGLLRDLFAYRFEILETDDAAGVREKMERGVAGFLEQDPQAELKAHFIGHLIGYDFSASPHLKGALGDSGQLREQALAYLGQLFSAAAAKQPVLLLFEDIHWADERSLDAIAHVVASWPNLRLVVVCLARPSLFERMASWGEGRSYHQRVALKPLSKLDSRRLVGEILRKVEAVPADLRDLIVTNAEGNPFYVEELIKMLCEEGVIVKGEARWRVESGRLAELKVPPTLTGVLQARLDSLAPAERETLQRASVVGRIFWDSAVDRLGEGGAGGGPDVLGALRGKEMVFRRDSSAFAGTQEYIFKHALLRDVTYESVLKRARLKFHAQVADWLVVQSGDRAGEYSRLIAEHYELAGELRKAAEFLERAGTRTLRVSAYAEAKECFERALKLLPETENGGAALRIALMRQLGEAQVGLGDYTGARGCYEISLALARGCRDSKGMADAGSSLSYVAFAIGDYASAELRAGESIALSRESNDQAGLADAQFRLSLCVAAQGRYAEGKSAAVESLALFERLGDAAGMARCLNSLGNIAADLKAYGEAKAHYQKSMALSRDVGNRFGVGCALNNMGLAVFQLGERAEARRLYLEAMVIFQEIGIKRGLASCLDSLGELEFGGGNVEAAEVHYLACLKLASEIGGLSFVLGAIAGLAPIRARVMGAQTALEWLGLALSHPSSAPDIRQRAGDLLPALRAGMSDAEADAALKRGADLPLDEIVKAILKKDGAGDGNRTHV